MEVHPYGFLSLLPPILAILLCFLTKEVLFSLFMGIWVGATILASWNPWSGFLSTFDNYVLRALVPKDGGTWNAAVIIFSMTLAGAVGVMGRSGGTLAIVQNLSKRAKTPRGAQFFSWLMGLIVFFDDYANTLLVGHTMRPLTDKMRVSREKLAYIVDSTASPVASWALVSTWIGYELGLIQQAFEKIGLQENAYLVFLNTIPYRFYSLGAVFMVLLTILLQREYGPMYHAELRARRTGKVLRDDAKPLASPELTKFEVPEGKPLRAINAWIPILTMILVTFVGLWYNGGGLEKPLTLTGIREAVGNADASIVLLWSSFTTSAVAIILAVSQRILTLSQAFEAWVDGAKSLLIALIILTLAWAIKGVCDDMKTAEYIISLTKGHLSPHFVPVVIFIVAMFVSFATGTSWGTMGILMPLAIPLAHALGAPLIATIGAVLTGSVFGDHCSPISDTTIMSSMASACDHMDHVSTQLPYSITVAIISVFVGYIPSGYGLNPGLSLLILFALLFIAVRVLGKPVDNIGLDGIDSSQKVLNG
ncbi:MAG: NhaC family transporter [bacterium 42_11]|nr:MAG: NhaC family transporter [bacterium 42_11]